MKHAVLLPAALAPVAVLLTAFAGSRLLLPVLATLAVYPFMVLLVARGRQAAAAVAVLLWAASLSAAIVALAARDPARAGDLVIHGPTYRDEMFAFIRSGQGREAEPFRFLPQHGLHLGAFVVLTSLSGGLLGIGLGALLVGYMSYYVGALAAAGSAPWTAFLLGWPPYAILRVAAYALLGVALSRPVVSLVMRRSIPFEGSRAFYLLAGGLLLADVALKAALAPAWASLLRPCLGAP